MDPTKGDESPITLPSSIVDSQTAMEGKTDETFIKYWLQQIQDCHTREKDWRKDAMRAVDLYEAQKKKDYQYNILYSNTETFAPALYNQVPRPVVTRRFKDPDPLGKVCSEVVQRTISFLADANESEYPTFDEIMTQAVLDALVPGRGVTRFKHEVEFEQPEKPDGLSSIVKEQSGGTASPSTSNQPDEDGEGQQASNEAGEIPYETVVAECIPWERFTHGYAKQWRHVPWIAIDHYMTREELCQNFGTELGAQVKLTETEKESEEGVKAEDKWSKKGQTSRGVQLGLVHEIWNKVDKQVFFISPGLPRQVIRKCADPLGVTGFFPVVEPLRFFKKVKTLTPTTLYSQYEEQHKELNRITVRINRIIGAMKVRGFYDKRASGLDRLMQQDDNTLLPAENMPMFGPDAINLDTIIWLWPIDKLVGVLQQLYTAREAIKAVIYDITGVADVMRGASRASETLGAQEIKEQWGSLRISRMQKQVQNYARECFRMMGEIAMTKLGADTISKMTGLQYPTGEQKAQAQMMLQQGQQLMQQLASMMPPPPQPGQPPPQPPPQIQQLQQQMAQAQQIASQPSWDDILGLLDNTLARAYRIDIETNSTIDPEATDDKEQINELFIAIGQFVNSMMPLIESGAMPMETVKGMLLVTIRRFRFGPELEDYIDKIQQPQPKPDPRQAAEQVKLQAAQQQSQLDAQLAQQKHANEMQMEQARAQIETQKHQMELTQMASRMQIEEQKLEIERQKMQLELATLAAKAETARQIAATKPKQVAVSTTRPRGR